MTEEEYGEPNEESLEMFRELFRWKLDQQLAIADFHSNRGYQIAGFASVVLALAGVAGIESIWLGIAVTAAYVLALIGCAVAVWPREFNLGPDGLPFWEATYDATPAELRHSLIENMTGAHEKNKQPLFWRAIGVHIAVAGLAFETLAAAAAIVTAI